MSNYQFNIDSKIVNQIETKYRKIKTEIPCSGTRETLNTLSNFESRSMQGQMPIVWDRAKGYSLYDSAENKWIDFTSTIFVSNVGHANTRVIDSIQNILNKPLMHSYAYAHQLRSEYHKKLIEFAGSNFEKAFMLSAGTEATEAALKLMRMNSLQIGKNKPGVICIEGNWHGRTMGAQMMSGNADQKEWIGYQDPNIHHISFPYPWSMNGLSGKEFLSQSLKKLEEKGVDISTDICGFMLETFQGWGAVFYPKDFVSAIREVADKYNILLTFDEMQSGFGRTGKKFGYEHYNVKADLLCCGKGIASGYPLSAVIGEKHVMDLPSIGNMSSTHSANPIACAAGLATLEEIERLDLVNETERKSKILFSKLQQIKEKFSDRVSYILGEGLIAAILFKDPESNEPDHESPSEICEKAMEQGVLFVHTGRESIKLGPPLVIDDGALIEGLDVLEGCIENLKR